jgi:ferredoxin-type protein NapF
LIAGETLLIHRGKALKRSIDRLQFIHGDLSGSRRGIRPPWSKPEALFTECCERRDACISACPQQILRRGSAGFPVVDFRQGACTFCGDCATSCKQEAFDLSAMRDSPAWQLDFSIGDQCLALRGVVCRSCGECFAICPVRCISVSQGQRECAAWG